MPTICLEEVTKEYGKKNQRMTAIRDVDLTIEQGEFLFFIGSRGAGKTTLLQIISGELRPDSGTVFLNDVDVTGPARRPTGMLRSCMGRVPQESQLIRTNTVLQNLTGKKWLGIMSEKQKVLVNKALGLVGMAGSEDMYPLELSIAQCRRVELAKAIINSPPILILDDITSRLDNGTSWDIIQLLREMNIHGTTILMSTNSKQIVNMMRKRVITLSDGRIVGDVRRGKYGYIV